MTDGTWQMTDGRWQMADDRWHMARGTWHMAHGTWHMADGRWHMANGTWQMVPGHYSLLTRHSLLATRHSLLATRHCFSTAMGTVGIVQAAFGNQEIIEDFSSQDCFGDDPGNVLGGDPAIPDSLGIDHDVRSVLALVEAAGMIGPGQGTESGLPEFDLESFLERLEARRVAATPLVARVADVTADEYVVREGRHVSSHEMRLKSVATDQGKTLCRGRVRHRQDSIRTDPSSVHFSTGRSSGFALGTGRE